MKNVLEKAERDTINAEIEVRRCRKKLAAAMKKSATSVQVHKKTCKLAEAESKFKKALERRERLRKWAKEEEA